MFRFIIVVAFLSIQLNTFGQSINTALKITQLTGDFYVFTTYKFVGEKKQPANGMYLVTADGVILFDTPWDTFPFQLLLDSIEVKHHKKVIMCIATHSHEDRTSGLAYYQKQGIKTFTTRQTDEISIKNKTPRAEFLMEKDTLFANAPYQFQTFYAGAGHTNDNIVIWFAKEKILYGGCLVKSTEAKELGYIAEADLEEWPKSIKKIQSKFKNPTFIIPGHYDWNNIQSLEHTLKLLEEKKNN